MNNEIAKLAAKKKYWKAKGPDNTTIRIPLDELEADHLQRAYLRMQNKELESYNFMMKIFKEYERFAEIRKDLFEEAKRRGQILTSLEEVSNNVGDFFLNEWFYNKRIKENA